MGTNHKVNAPKISHNFFRWQYWLGKTKPKQPFRLTWNTFKRLLKNMEFSTDWLTTWCLQTRVTWQWLRLLVCFFFTVQCRFSPRGAFCHVAVHTMHSSWTYQGPPLCPFHLCSPWKGVNFLVGTWWLQFLFRNFLRPRFSTLQQIFTHQ